MSQSFDSGDRFLLVLLASRRVREIEGGSILMVPRGKDCDTVVALREVAQEALDMDQLRGSLLSELRSVSSVGADASDVEEDELVDAGVDETFLASIQEEVQKVD